MTTIYQWGNAPRALLEDLARESVTYWHTPGPGPKPLATALCRALDRLCAAARRRRTKAEVDAEIGDLSRRLVWLLSRQPVDVEAAAAVSARIEQLCLEETADPCPPDCPECERDRAEGAAPDGAGAGCAECIDLQGRLVNIYHLTLTGDGNGPRLVEAIRNASKPGAPAPAPIVISSVEQADALYGSDSGASEFMRRFGQSPVPSPVIAVRPSEGGSDA